MHAFPHVYRVTGRSRGTGDVELSAAGLAALRSASPAEFDGAGDLWSPETLLVGAVADCLVLTFRAVAHASKLPWISLECDVRGTLDRIDRVTQFTRFDVAARLIVPVGVRSDHARNALEKAERTCLISNSLKAAIALDTTVEVDPQTVRRDETQ